MGLRTLCWMVLATLFAFGTSVVFSIGTPNSIRAASGPGIAQDVLPAAQLAQTETVAQEHEDEEDNQDEEQEEEEEEQDEEEEDEDEEEEDEDEEDLETYESPTLDYTITFDSSTWRVREESTNEDEAGNVWDFVQLRQLGGAYVTFYGVTGPSFAFADAQECVFELASFVAGLEGVDDVEQRDDVDEGDDEDAVIVIDYEFTAEGSEPRDYTNYLRCQTIEEEESYLQTWYDITADDYEDEAEDREALLEGVEIG